MENKGKLLVGTLTVTAATMAGGAYQVLFVNKKKRTDPKNLGITGIAALSGAGIYLMGAKFFMGKYPPTPVETGGQARRSSFAGNTVSDLTNFMEVSY